MHLMMLPVIMHLISLMRLEQIDLSFIHSTCMADGRMLGLLYFKQSAHLHWWSFTWTLVHKYASDQMPLQR